MHDGITGIQTGAFEGSPLKGELVLPKDLTTLGANAFFGCDFSGTLKLPNDIASIGMVLLPATGVLWVLLNFLMACRQ